MLGAEHETREQAQGNSEWLGHLLLDPRHLEPLEAVELLLRE